jgi:phage terminase large subunit-like protein
MKKTDYVATAAKYAAEIVAGEIPACLYVRQACARHLEDLERSRKSEFPYKLDAKRAASICAFIELLPHIKGPKAGEGIKLEPWQLFILVSVFGWVSKVTGKRRFRKVYIEVPRGNAKSTLSAGVGLYCLAADGEAGAEVYSVATTKDQARIVFETAQQMARKSPGYRKRFGVKFQAHTVAQPESGSIFKALAADSDKLDGLNVHLGIVDEFHAHPNRGVYDVIETATAKREQSLLWCITTSGTDRAGICYEIRGYLVKILAGVLQDESTFGLIYGLDEGDSKRNPPISGDDWVDPASAVKANPNWGISVVPEVVRQLVEKAIATPSAQNNVKTKHFDVWVNADVAWLDMRKYQAGTVSGLKIEDFSKERCFAAVDLASKIDVAAVVRIFFRMIDGVRHYYCFPLFYLPETRIQESSNAQYVGWARQGFFRVTSGNVIDFDEIERELKSWPEKFEIVSVAFDPFQATQFSTHMLEQGFPMMEVGQTVKNMSDPMKELDALVRASRWHHDGNPVMEWMMSNVTAHYDHKDNIFPNKERPENKIDGPVAAIVALGRAMVEPNPPAPFKPFVV